MQRRDALVTGGKLPGSLIAGLGHGRKLLLEPGPGALKLCYQPVRPLDLALALLRLLPGRAQPALERFDPVGTDAHFAAGLLQELGALDGVSLKTITRFGKLTQVGCEALVLGRSLGHALLHCCELLLQRGKLLLAGGNILAAGVTGPGGLGKLLLQGRPLTRQLLEI